MTQNLPILAVSHLWAKLCVVFGVISGLVLLSCAAGAAESSIPWQCTSYTYSGNSQEECIENLKKNEQQEQVAKLERKLKYQELALSDLNRKLNREIRRNRQEEQVLRPAYGYAPPAYGYAPPPLLGNPLFPRFGYGPSLGFGLAPFPFLPSIGIVID